MQLTEVAQIFGLTMEAITTILSGYNAFRKTNVEKFFEKIVKENIDLSKIGNEEYLSRRFYNIMEIVSLEANTEKIENWKNVVIHLVTDYYNFDYNDNFVEILKVLTVFDLTILHKIYTKEFQNEHFEEELIEILKLDNIQNEYIMMAIKRLASHCLIDEKHDATGLLSEGKPILANMYYSKNEIGSKFLGFISTQN